MSGGRAPTPHVQLLAISKAYGPNRAVEELTLSVKRGSFTTLLGPSGCGKTTALRILAGFLEPDAGRVLIDGVDQAGRPPNQRGVGMVFQEYALFPHLSVRANVEYGLRMRRVPRLERGTRAEKTLELLGLQGLGGRYPHQLSGGQQQRVALGRALVLEPGVLLMDEPLSNLDARLRSRLRAELRSLQQRLKITTVYVTHDQEEALSLSDQVVVMNAGRVQQSGTPERIYRSPINRFVAEFVGHANILPATAELTSAGQLRAAVSGRQLLARLPDERRPQAGREGYVMVRPESAALLTLNEAAPAQGGAWTVDVRVTARDYFGAFERYWLQLAGNEEPWLVDVPTGESRGARRLPQVGEPARLLVPPGAACWLW